jgi:hypothetical protein
MNLMSNDLYQTLDNRLAQLQQTDPGLEPLKAELSDGQQELQSLLMLAQSMEALEPSGPRPAFVRNTRVRAWNRIRSDLKESRDVAVSRRGYKLRWRRAVAGGLLALLLVFSGLGVASASALPGDALYGLKRGFESFQIALTFSQHQEAGLLAQFAEERVEEIEALSQLDRPDDLARALHDYNQTMDDFLNLAQTLDDDWDGNLEDVQAVISHNTAVLQSVQERVPENAQQAIQQAIERSSHGQSVLEILQQGGRPSELAPGQQNQPGNDSNEQSNDHSNNGNAYGHDKEKKNSNHGQGNPHNQSNPPVNPQDFVDDAQED